MPTAYRTLTVSTVLAKPTGRSVLSPVAKSEAVADSDLRVDSCCVKPLSRNAVRRLLKPK